MAAGWARARGGACGAAVLLAACAAPAPDPVDPAGSVQALQARRLDDPRLQRFIQSERPSQPTQAPAPWDLDRLTLAALYFHPDLSIARSQLRIAQAQALTARSRPNPGLAATVGRGAGGVLASPWIVGAAIDFVLESGDRRALRRSQTELQVTAARADLQQACWLVRARVYSALLDLWGAQRRLDPLREQLALQSERARLLELRVESGENPRADLRRELAQREQYAAALAQAEGERAQARVDLAEAIGVPVAALDDARVSTEGFDRPPALDDSVLADPVRRHALLDRADVRDALAQIDVAQADLKIQLSRRWPDLRVGPGYLFDQGTNKYQVSIGLDWPRSVQGPVAEALARRDLAAGRVLALQARIIGQIDRASVAWHTSVQLATAGESLLGQAQQRERAATAQFEAGSLDRPALLGARIDRLEALRSLQAARERQRRALASLEDALQWPLEAGQAAPSAPESDPGASASLSQ